MATNMTNTTTTTNRKAGRPQVTVNWPQGQFTVEQLKAETGLSKVTLYLKLKKAVAASELVISGKQNTKQGRPRILFAQNKQDSNAAVVTTVPA